MSRDEMAERSKRAGIEWTIVALRALSLEISVRRVMRAITWEDSDGRALEA
jgi:hypothetical protein